MLKSAVLLAALFALASPAHGDPVSYESLIAAESAAKGNWYVQIGAFQNASVAKNGWNQATRRFAALQGHVPTGTAFTSKIGAVYRLSVGGFTRGDADAMCRRYRDAGGACFVRAGAGDQTAQWLRKPATQLASS